MRNAVELGLDFLAVTDHNTSTHFEDWTRLAAHPEALEGPIVLIPGEEVTTYWGHANMWGLREWIDFRCADEASIDAVRRYVLQKGGLISVNHPKCVGPPWLFRGWERLPVDGGVAGAVAVLQLGVAGALGRAAAQGRARRRRRRLGRALDPAGGAAPPARPREPDDVGLRRADRGVGPRRHPRGPRLHHRCAERHAAHPHRRRGWRRALRDADGRHDRAVRMAARCGFASRCAAGWTGGCG